MGAKVCVSDQRPWWRVRRSCGRILGSRAANQQSSTSSLTSHKIMTASNELLVVRDGTTTEEALELQASSYRPAWAKILKRTIDIVCACLGMMVLAPLMALVAIFIRLQDGGAVFHRRRVVGPRGSFDAFKFRTMRPDA